MKNIIKKVVFISTFAVFFMAPVAFAAFPFNTDAKDCPTVAIGNFTTGVGVPSTGGGGCQTWSLTNVSANPGDVINVHIYYHNSSSANADNVRVTLNPLITGSSMSHSFTGSITSAQGNTSFGPVSVSLSSAQTLTFEDLRWYPNQSAASNNPSPLPNGQSNSSLLNGGVSLGTIAPGWNTQGNFVAKFRVGTTQSQNQCVITNFSANPSSITSGSPITLSWSTTNCTTVTIPGVGTFGPSGQAVVYPNSTTTYTATATGNNGTDSRSTTVTVNNQGTGVTVTTYAASDIEEESATLEGFASGNGVNIDAWLEFPCYGNQYGHRYNVTSTNLSYDKKNLDPDTTYRYCAVARNLNNGNITRGQEVTFRTDDDGGSNNNEEEPDVDTRSATNVERTSATLNGTVDGNGDYTTRWFRYGTNRNNLNNKTRTVNHGTGRRSISESIYGLNQNTRYYFQAVAENSYGEVEGDILSFSTDASVVDNGSSSSAVTTLATNIGQNYAQLNGLFINGENESSTGYFEYGTSVSLGLRTSSKNIGSDSSIQFWDTISGLSPNTIYYFRAVTNNSEGTFRGNIEFFRTNNIVINNPTTPRTTIITTRTGTASPIMLKIENRYEFISIGETIDYIVTYKNIGSSKLTNPLLQVILPAHIVFTGASRGTFDVNKNTLNIPLADLNPSDEGTVYVQGRVISLPENRSQIVTTALLVYTTPGNAQENAFAYVLNNGRYDNLGASAFFAGFFPNTLFGFLLWIALILFILWIIRELIERRKADKNRYYNQYPNGFVNPQRNNESNFYQNHPPKDIPHT